MRITIQRHFYRTGQIREEIPLRNGRRHGLARTWHKNGVLASEEPWQNGVPHGICHQWNETGRLLGKCKLVRGTGIQRAWHDNGQLQMEISTVRGEFSGQTRIWLRDGTLLAERFHVHGRIVTPDEYREAAAKTKSLPRFRGKPAKLPPKNGATQKHIYQVFVTSLLERRARREVGAWLKHGGDNSAHSLGRFKRESDAAKFVQQLYHAGATKVIAPDIYGNKAGDQFVDCLLVRLPKNTAKRKAIRQVCGQLRKRDLGAMQPDQDIGETHLYLYLA